MSATAVRPITIRQFLRFQAPEGFRCELINGEIVLFPDPQATHYDICDRFYKALEQVCPEPEYKVLQRINLRMKSTIQMPSPDLMVIDYQSWVHAQTSGYPATTPFLPLKLFLLPTGRRGLPKRCRFISERAFLRCGSFIPNASL